MRLWSFFGIPVLARPRRPASLISQSLRRNTSTLRNCRGSCTTRTHSASGNSERKPSSACWILKRQVIIGQCSVRSASQSCFIQCNWHWCILHVLGTYQMSNPIWQGWSYITGNTCFTGKEKMMVDTVVGISFHLRTTWPVRSALALWFIMWDLSNNFGLV